MLIEKYFGIDRETAQQMIAATQNMANDRSGDNGFQSTRVFLFERHAVLKMQNITFRNVDTLDPDLTHLEQLAATLLNLQAQGVNVVPIVAYQSVDGEGYIIQQRAIGAELYDRHKMKDKNYVLSRVEELSNAAQAHFDKFVADVISIIRAGVLIDFVGKDNFFYDETSGFQFIDLNAHLDYVYGLSDVKPDAAKLAAWNCFIPCYFDAVPTYRDTVSQLLFELSDNEKFLLQKQNNAIFCKCKTALVNNGISDEIINGILQNERFIPQKQQLELLTYNR